MNLEQSLCKYISQDISFLAGNHKFSQILGL